MLRKLTAIVATVCVALTIAHFMPSQDGPRRQHQSAREQQTLADAMHNRK